jgi:hypothetical protein
MAVDLLRSCYRTKMRFFSDSDIETEVVWYFTEPGAQVLPFYTRFASGNWATERVEWPGVGEVLFAPRPYSKGENPGRYFGERYCGSPQHFAAGQPLPPARPVPVTRSGEPLCCLIDQEFGALGGGSAMVHGLNPHHLVGSGGAAGDGAAVFKVPPHLVGSGGAAGDGAAVFKVPPHLVGSGGAAGDGVALSVRALVAEGGAAGDGAAELVAAAHLVAEGGAAGDGAAELVAAAHLVAEGGAAGDGAK